MVAIIVVLVIVVLAAFALARAVRMVPQANAVVVERFGRYTRTLEAGLSILVPFVDRVRITHDLREQVVPFPPQPVITKDNLEVSIDTVIYYQITNPRDATYEIANYIQGIEQLTVTTLRNIIGGMDLERTLTSRDSINDQLRGVLDDATGKWGIRVNRVELKAIEAPLSIRDAMEKQMRADRERRAAILSAEGVKQSEILRAEGERQSAILRAEGDARSKVLEAEGEAKAIREVFDAIHEGKPDNELLAYQYLTKLPEIAKGDANKVWIVPSELGRALEGLGGAMGRITNGNGTPSPSAPAAVPPPPPVAPAAETPAIPGAQPATVPAAPPAVASSEAPGPAPAPAPPGPRTPPTPGPEGEAAEPASAGRTVPEARSGWSSRPLFRDEPIRSTAPPDDTFILDDENWPEAPPRPQSQYSPGGTPDLPEATEGTEGTGEDRAGRREFWTGPYRTRRAHPFLEDDGDDLE